MEFFHFSDFSAKHINCLLTLSDFFIHWNRFIGNKFSADFYKRQAILGKGRKVRNCSGNRQIKLFAVFCFFRRIFCSSMHRFDSGKPQVIHNFIQKFDPFVQRVQKCHLQMWINNLQRDSRKAGSGPDIDQAVYFFHLHIFCRCHAVHKMFLHHFVKFSDPGEVHHFIPFYQQLIIFLKLFNLLLCQCHAKCLTSIF